VVRFLDGDSDYRPQPMRPGITAFPAPVAFMPPAGELRDGAPVPGRSCSRCDGAARGQGDAPVPGAAPAPQATGALPDGAPRALEPGPQTATLSGSAKVGLGVVAGIVALYMFSG